MGTGTQANRATRWLWWAAVVLLISAIAVFLLSRRQPADVLFDGSFDTGNTEQWDQEHSGPDDDDDVYAQSKIKFEGAYGGKFIVEPGDKFHGTTGERAEVSKGLTDYLIFREGDERWFGWSVLFPSDFPFEPHDDPTKETWNIFTSWHHTGSTCSVPLDLAVDSGATPRRIVLTQRTGTLDGCRLSGREFVLGELDLGRWTSFELRIRFSSDPEVGFVEAYVNGERVLPRTRMATLYQGYSNYLNQGFYRDDWPDGETATLYIDGTRIGSSRNAVRQ